VGLGGVIYRNTCGKWQIEVADPHPAWITLTFEERGWTLIKVEDLRDLRHLIDRAEAKIVARGAE
jgi:hypothetical protein